VAAFSLCYVPGFFGRDCVNVGFLESVRSDLFRKGGVGWIDRLMDGWVSRLGRFATNSARDRLNVEKITRSQVNSVIEGL
jgi:hypothetical protein